MTAAAGRNAAVRPTQAAPTTSATTRWREAAHVETLERVDVADHPAEQLAAPVALELAGRERLDALVEARAGPAQRPERDVVRGEALEVAGDRPGEAEEAHRDDRHRQREDRRLLGRARDQVPGRRHQPDAAAGREHAERGREGEPARGQTGEVDEPRERPRHAATAVATIRPSAQVHDPVGSRGELRAMDDQEHRPVGAQAFDRLAHELGARRVEVGGRLVEDHERRIAEERAGERDPLGLSSRERPPAVADQRLVAVRKLADETVGAGQPRRVGDVAIAGARVPEADVVRDGATEERRVLRHPGDLRAPGRGRARTEILRRRR